VRIEFVYERILPAHQGFQGGETITFFQRGLFRLIVEAHVSLKGKASV
jgi:hypothetical protein